LLQAIVPAGFSASWARRLSLRVFECFRFGFAIPVIPYLSEKTPWLLTPQGFQLRLPVKINYYFSSKSAV
jgi:hypothetical protein